MGNNNGHLSGNRKNNGYRSNSKVISPALEAEYVDFTSSEINSIPVTTNINSSIKGEEYIIKNTPPPPTVNIAPSISMKKKKNEISKETIDENSTEFSPTVMTRKRAATIGTRPRPVIKKDVVKTIPTVFQWVVPHKSEEKPKEVMLSGTFNNWSDMIPMNSSSHSNFVTILNLPEGSHQYKFRVDGVWKHCENSESLIDDGLGGKNNVIQVTSADYEVFDALDMDIKDLNKSRKASLNNNHNKMFSTDCFCQEIPDFNQLTNKLSGGKINPPILPPHLLQVILNKDTPLSCEPTLLPTPNHVMINHLYALSIKDKVMVMSSTQRYRKKYVTTVLYRPIED